MKIYKWEILPDQKQTFSGFDHLDTVVWNIFKKLNLKEVTQAQEFIKPESKNLIDSGKLFDTETASSFILDAIKKKRKFVIHGDYDVDGIVATAILWDFLYRELKADVLPIIPNRFDDGYGLSESTIKKAKDANIIITVDCGIRDIELIKKYPDIDFIITDHHSFSKDKNGNPQIPEADNLKAIVHPDYPDHSFPFPSIAGATVVWKLIDQIAKFAKNDTFFQLGKFNSMQYISKVAIATVTDIMPLIFENRIIVSQALQELKSTENKITKTILRETGIKQSDLSAYHFGYIIGPRLNAAGRIHDAMDALRLLCTQNETEAGQIIQKLNKLNTQRQNLTIKILKEAKLQISGLNDETKIIIVSGQDWPEGIIGLIAGKLQDEYYLPVLAISVNNQTAKGSARSIKGYDITQALSRCQKLLTRFGGHAMASGFSLNTENLEKFISLMQKDANKNLKDEDLIPILDITKELKLQELNLKLWETIQLFEPFGYKNPKPKFVFKDVSILAKRSFGKNNEYTELSLVDSDKQNITKALSFNHSQILQNLANATSLDVVATVELDTWKNKNQIQLNIVDFKIKNQI